MALITTRSMAKRDLHEHQLGDGERQDMAMSEGENFSPKSSDPQPIGRREIENSQPQSSDIRPIEIQKHNSALSFTEIHLIEAQPAKSRTHHHYQPPSTNLPASNTAQIDISIDDFHLWHGSLGHTSLRALRKLGFVMADRQSSPCKTCAFAKQTRIPYRRYEHKATRPLWHVHSNMSGMQMLAIDGKMYFITYIDDFIRYCWIYFTNRRDAKTIHDIYI